MADLRVLYALTLALGVLLAPEGGLVPGDCAPGLSANALAAAEECTGKFAALEVVGASISGVATLGAGFATGALCVRRDVVKVDVLTFRVGAAVFLTGACLKRVLRPPA